MWVGDTQDKAQGQALLCESLYKGGITNKENEQKKKQRTRTMNQKCAQSERKREKGKRRAITFVCAFTRAKKQEEACEREPRKPSAQNTPESQSLLSVLGVPTSGSESNSPPRSTRHVNDGRLLKANRIPLLTRANTTTTTTRTGLRGQTQKSGSSSCL